MKVSVITIVKNNKDSIERCIQSVLAQDYVNIEHIVIDGGSTDGTLQVIQKYANSIAKLVSEKDVGMYNALNKGIQHASGELIGVLHSDDIYTYNGVIKDVVDRFKETNADIVYANGMYVNKKDTTYVKRIYTSKTYKNKFLPFGWIPLHTTMYVKKDLYDTYGLYDESFSIASDYEISLRWFTNSAIKKVFLDKWVVKMSFGGKSTTPSLQHKKSAEDYKIIRKYKLLGFLTLFFKIARKIHQYLLPRFKSYKI